MAGVVSITGGPLQSTLMTLPTRLPGAPDLRLDLGVGLDQRRTIHQACDVDAMPSLADRRHRSAES
jgi:hypothetical protein